MSLDPYVQKLWGSFPGLYTPVTLWDTTWESVTFSTENWDGFPVLFEEALYPEGGPDDYALLITGSHWTGMSISLTSIPYATDVSDELLDHLESLIGVASVDERPDLERIYGFSGWESVVDTVGIPSVLLGRTFTYTVEPAALVSDEFGTYVRSGRIILKPSRYRSFADRKETQWFFGESAAKISFGDSPTLKGLKEYYEFTRVVTCYGSCSLVGCVNCEWTHSVCDDCGHLMNPCGSVDSVPFVEGC